ncbi:MAG: virginiamycin B lyase family protein, partial [bacterium]
LAPGAQASISTTYSGLAQSLYQLGFGVTTLINILAWGKAVPAKIGTSAMTYNEWIQIAKTMKDFLDDKDCDNAVLGLNPGKFFVDCLNWDALKKAFGWKWLLLSPITLVSSIAEFFRSEFNAMGDILNGRSEYQVLVGELKEYQGIAYKFSGISPNDITTGPDGNLWFTYGVGYNGNGGGIGKITLDGILTKYPLPASRTNNPPRSITKGPDGNLWFTIPGDVPLFAPPDAGPGTPGQIGRITSKGVITLFPPAKSDSNPVAVTPGPDGNLWFTDTDHNIGRITPDGHITEFPVPTIAGITYIPWGGIVTGKDSNLWFATLGGIGKITPNGKVTMF